MIVQRWGECRTAGEEARRAGAERPHRGPPRRALDPFFRIIRKGLTGLVDGEHFFDLLAEDIVIEYVVSVPGYPRRVQGRRAVADLCRGYGDAMSLERADELTVHHDPHTSVVVLEYAVHGRAVHTGRADDNHFVSVITVKDRQVAHWRDYLDPVAVFRALGWPAEPRQHDATS
ncbi:nuclear transport factor 2 family protein [Streptomyces sp. YGL11-2]|uniref:nuclear transport factor 2 family protein n=1 Tax=Streptomyces sp. YGL11-2 TaxID=3414028 RepID=UPI003CE977CA